MAVESLANVASTTLSAAITSTTATSISVKSATGFPTSGNYAIVVDNGTSSAEIMEVTGGQGTTTWTVVRASEPLGGSQTAYTHLDGATVAQVLTVGGLTGYSGAYVAKPGETELTTTTATTIFTYTPATTGMYVLYMYARVVTAATTVSASLTYTSSSGAQTYDIWSSQSLAVGDSAAVPYFFQATAAAITLSVTAGTASQVYIDARLAVA